MNKKSIRFIAFVLAFEVLFTSIGVAQVSHICKMAMTGMEQGSCSMKKTKEHDCCSTFSKVQNELKNSCCKNEVKYFKNNITTIIQEFLKLPVLYSVTDFFSNKYFEAFSVENKLAFSWRTKPIDSSGSTIYISIQSFLI